MVEGRVRPPSIGFFPYPPVNNRHVIWCHDNLPAIEAMLVMPDKDAPDHRAQVAALVAGLFMLYTNPVDRTMAADKFNQEVQRRKIIAESFVNDLSSYPAWAVAAGIEAFRGTAESQWAPKTPGQLLVHISGALSKAQRSKIAAERILEAERLGRNVDALEAKLIVTDERARAEAALDIMRLLESTCDVYADEVANGLHRKCHKIFHEWRKKNPLPKENNHG